jgi:hypothetical protein
MERASINACTAVGALGTIGDRHIFRPDHQIRPVVFTQDLQIMAATGATATQSKDFMVRHIKAQMNQTAFVGLPQDALGFIEGGKPAPALGNILVSDFV